MEIFNFWILFFFRMAHQRSNIPYQAQNDMLEQELAAKTNRLKSIAIKIGDEARYQNKLLADMVWFQENLMPDTWYTRTVKSLS